MFMQAAAEEGTLIQSMQEAKANLTGTMKTFENQTCASDIAAALAAHRFLLLFKISTTFGKACSIDFFHALDFRECNRECPSH